MAHQLPFTGPFTVLFRGTHDAAGTVLAHTHRAGLPAHLLYAHDPTTAPRGAWMVVMAHALPRA